MSNVLPTLSLAGLLLTLSGCTSVNVTPLQNKPSSLCIEENPKVKVRDFVPVLQEGFSRHAIATQLYAQIPRPECPYVLTYTARRSWDMAPYLSSAELTILGPRRQIVAKANYHLRGKGGLSLMKWQGTKSKMDPVIDELLGAAKMIDVPAADASTAAPTARSASLDQRLRDLQQQNLDYEAYQRAYRQLLIERQQPTP
ncbi:hypothetical protein D16iCDA_13470 [Pseudomonas seleniipraecipitans]|uniref:Lipoprotein n=1 Tax=Phytopseudomonas seleniipraecipitans TaxID=640205 RepID=A0ABY5J7P1_9GAMM|nr:Sbal_3080 family lipoprotein [Pseudomonas seleniipraecipitans]UUD62708.1 hypothetical protein D16iCDA_13470 [Pseudomonas seleniipraecipitans]